MKPKLITIGYWKSILEPELPDPANFEDPKWDSNERNLIINHLKKGKSIATWMGISWCRYRCINNNMGSSCLTDGAYLFPEKLFHYIESHYVRLPQKFIEHVKNFKYQRILNEISDYDIDYNSWKLECGHVNNKETKTYLARTNEEIELFNRKKATINK